MARVITPKTKPKRIEWLKQLLDTTIEKNQSLWETPRTYFRASSVGNPCDRCLALDMFGHRIPFDAKTLRIFKVGNSNEEVVLNTLDNAGTLISQQGEVEFNLEGTPLIKGHYDAIIQGFGKEYLLEFKTINEFSFAKLPTEHGPILASESPLMKRYPKYIHQWNTYAGSSDTPNDGMILFEAKNSQKHKVYELIHDQLLFSELLYRLELIQNHVIVGMIPARKRDEDCRNYLCKKLPPEKIDIDQVMKIDGELRG